MLKQTLPTMIKITKNDFYGTYVVLMLNSDDNNTSKNESKKSMRRTICINMATNNLNLMFFS